MVDKEVTNMEYPSYLIHYGVKGQHWGERQYQYKDGTYTLLGKERRRIGPHDYGSTLEKKAHSTGGGGANIKELKKHAKIINGGNIGHDFGLNRNVNCAFCTMSYELRRRGFDVRAQESLRGVQVGLTDAKGSYGKVIPNFKKVVKNSREFAHRESNQSSKMASIGMTKKEYKEMEDTLLSDGENSRGFISCSWKGYAGGHIFNYEVIDGKLYFVDSQSGKVTKGKNLYESYFKMANNIQTLRSDNLKINIDKAKKYYSEDNTGKIKLNKAAQLQVATGIIGGILGFGVGVPHIGALIGYSLLDKKVEEIDNEASIDLQKKWEEEGRFKDKWYDFEEDKEKKK